MPTAIEEKQRSGNKPLTDPADLFRLLGRFGASLALFLITIVHLAMQRWVEAAVVGLISMGMQFWTLQLWRRLRKEREAAKAARAAEQESVV